MEEMNSLRGRWGQEVASSQVKSLGWERPRGLCEMKRWNHRQQTLMTQLRLNEGTLYSQDGAMPFLNFLSLAFPPQAPDSLHDEPATAWLGPEPAPGRPGSHLGQ